MMNKEGFLSRTLCRKAVPSLLVAVAALGAGLSLQGCATAGGGKAPSAPPVLGAASCSPVQDLSGSQLALTMAFAADTSGGLTGQDTAQIQSVTKKRADCLLEMQAHWNWKVVWGPVVTVKQNPVNPPPTSCQYYAVPAAARGQYIPAATMFVAQKGTQYYVGIAGTNQKSAFAWCDEDFNETLTAWPFGSPPSNAKIAQGTLDGLNLLLGMQDSTQPAGQRSLFEFLRKAASNGAIQVSVAGHSLGGAQAPVLGLWMKEVQSQWDIANFSKVSIYSFAGATPGNAGFANYLNSKFSGSSLAVINNTYDIVPHAWNSTTMNQVPDLYQAAQIQPSGDIDKLFESLLPKAGPEYTRLGQGTQQQCITGTLLEESDLNKEGPCVVFSTMNQDQIDALAPFGMEAIDQHTCAYANQLQMPRLLHNEGVCDYLNPETGDTAATK